MALYDNFKVKCFFVTEIDDASYIIFYNYMVVLKMYVS